MTEGNQIRAQLKNLIWTRVILNKLFSGVLDSPYIYNLVQHILEGDYADHIYRAVPTDISSRTIDVACGSGEFCFGIKGYYVGIDLNIKYLGYAKEKYGESNRFFVAMDALSLCFAEKSFDNAMIVNLMHHFDGGDFLRILKGVKRITKHIVVIADMIPAKFNPISKVLYRLDQGKYIRSLGDQKRIISKVVNIDKCAVFVSRRRLYIHSIFLCKI